MAENLEDKEFSVALFTTEDGAPMRFYIPACKEKATLRPLVERGGGILSSRRMPDSTVLAVRGNVVRDEKAIWTTFITDCCRENELLPMENYSCAEHDESLNISDDMEPADVVIRMEARDIKGRQRYSNEEDLRICRHIIDNYLVHDLGGNEVWKDMQGEKVTKHTWQSMRKHYFDHIKTRLGSLPLSPRDIAILSGTIVLPVGGHQDESQVIMDGSVDVDNDGNAGKNRKQNNDDMDVFDTELLEQATGRGKASAPSATQSAEMETVRQKKNKSITEFFKAKSPARDARRRITVTANGCKSTGVCDAGSAGGRSSSKRKLNSSRDDGEQSDQESPGPPVLEREDQLPVTSVSPAKSTSANVEFRDDSTKRTMPNLQISYSSPRRRHRSDRNQPVILLRNIADSSEEAQPPVHIKIERDSPSRNSPRLAAKSHNKQHSSTGRHNEGESSTSFSGAKDRSVPPTSPTRPTSQNPHSRSASPVIPVLTDSQGSASQHSLPPYTREQLEAEDFTKKDIFRFLQKNTPQEFQKANKLYGSWLIIRKQKKKSQLIEDYLKFYDDISHRKSSSQPQKNATAEHESSNEVVNREKRKSSRHVGSKRTNPSDHDQEKSGSHVGSKPTNSSNYDQGNDGNTENATLSSPERRSRLVASFYKEDQREHENTPQTPMASNRSSAPPDVIPEIDKSSANKRSAPVEKSRQQPEPLLPDPAVPGCSSWSNAKLRKISKQGGPPAKKHKPNVMRNFIFDDTVSTQELDVSSEVETVPSSQEPPNEEATQVKATIDHICGCLSLTPAEFLSVVHAQNGSITDAVAYILDYNPPQRVPWTAELDDKLLSATVEQYEELEKVFGKEELDDRLTYISGTSAAE